MEGLDLNNPLSSEQQELLLHAMTQHHLLLFRGAHIDAKAQQRLLQYFPHDRQAVEEQRFNNAFFQPRIPNAPLVKIQHNIWPYMQMHMNMEAEAVYLPDMICYKRVLGYTGADVRLLIQGQMQFVECSTTRSVTAYMHACCTTVQQHTPQLCAAY